MSVRVGMVASHVVTSTPVHLYGSSQSVDWERLNRAECAGFSHKHVRMTAASAEEHAEESLSHNQGDTLSDRPMRVSPWHNDASDRPPPLHLGADGFAEMDPALSVESGLRSEQLLRLRLQCLAEYGFVIIDDFETHPLLPRLEQASRAIHALCNAKIPLTLDTSRTYVHRVSEKRGESKGEQWTGKQHTFRGEEAWAIRGLLHPDWREFVADQPVFAEFLSSPETLDFVECWSGLTAQSPLAMSDATLFVNPREADFSEGWHRDTRWHGGADSNQQDKASTPPDWSPDAEKKRWAELQAQFQSRLERGLGAGGVSMFMALVEDDGCHELVPKSHREWRTDSQYQRLRKLDGKSGHAPMEDAIPIRLKPGQALVRDGVTIHRGRTKADKERLTLSWGWNKGSFAPFSGEPAVIDRRQRWKLSSAVREALPVRWFQEAYDRWRATHKDGGRLVDRLNANEMERLTEAELEEAHKPI